MTSQQPLRAVKSNKFIRKVVHVSPNEIQTQNKTEKNGRQTKENKLKYDNKWHVQDHKRKKKKEEKKAFKKNNSVLSQQGSDETTETSYSRSQNSDHSSSETEENSPNTSDSSSSENSHKIYFSPTFRNVTRKKS